jgi:hypothetical protein
MVLAGILFWITSITMHKFIMKNPQIKDICKPMSQPHNGSLQLNRPPETDDLAEKQAILDTTPLARAELLMSSAGLCCSPTTSFLSASTSSPVPRSSTPYQIIRCALLSFPSSRR